jgi:hypothetical protein
VWQEIKNRVRCKGAPEQIFNVRESMFANSHIVGDQLCAILKILVAKAENQTKGRGSIAVQQLSNISHSRPGMGRRREHLH